MNLRHIFILPALLAAMACSDDSPVTPDTPDTPEGPDITNSVEKLVSIDAGQTFQTIAGFGASDCWSPAFVGKSWTSHRAGITELLFSSEIVGGKPKGIGLSQWRVNLGGGSAAQGEASGIEDKSRRAESYLTDDLTYDWTRCEGQRYFMDRAKELGCNNFVLFSNTPPVQYTYNGKGFSARGGLSNLKPEHYGDFAGYMADVAARYTGEGYHISHISPVNEPQYNWDSGQEGSGWTNDEVAALARELDMSLDDRGLSTDILLGESGDWEYLYKVKGDANRSNIFSAFFTPGSSAYVGDLAHVKNLICGHTAHGTVCATCASKWPRLPVSIIWMFGRVNGVCWAIITAVPNSWATSRLLRWISLSTCRRSSTMTSLWLGCLPGVTGHRWMFPVGGIRTVFS